MRGTVAALAVGATGMLIASACGDVTDIAPASTGDGSADSAGDGATTSDGTTSSDGDTMDGGGADAAVDATACDECKPDFCGCGTCSDDQVVCTRTPKNCPLGCASGCDLAKYTCACAGDRCVHVSPIPSTIPCYATADCPPGKCCQPRSGILQGACVDGNACP